MCSPGPLPDCADQVRVSRCRDWRDGLGFCALLHRYRPDLLDWAATCPTRPNHNCSLAFTAAEIGLGVPALLEVL